MKKLIMSLSLLMSTFSMAGDFVFYNPVVGINSAKKGVQIYQDRAEAQMEDNCRSLNGEVVRYSCTTERKQDLSTVACAGVCRVQFQDESQVN